MRSILLSEPSVCSKGRVIRRSISSGEELLYWTWAVMPDDEMLGNDSSGRRPRATMPTTTAERVIIRVVTGRLSEKPDSDMANPLFSAVQQAVDDGNEH